MWAKILHIFGIHTYVVNEDDYEEWCINGRDGDISIWSYCIVCKEKKIIQTRY